MNQPHLPTRQPGEIIGKRYRLGESLGRGAFAEVFVATDLVVERSLGLGHAPIVSCRPMWLVRRSATGCSSD